MFEKFGKKLSRPKRTWVVRPTILLAEIIPPPMYGTAPRVVLGNKWWEETRQASYKSTDYHCQACGIPKHLAKYHQWLEGHELYDIDFLMGRMVYLETVPLCHSCHNSIHMGRLKGLLEQGKINPYKFADIVRHGTRVLADAGIVKPPPYEGPMAEWSDWRLVINDKEYPPVFKSLEDWNLAYNTKPKDGSE